MGDAGSRGSTAARRVPSLLLPVVPRNSRSTTTAGAPRLLRCLFVPRLVHRLLPSPAPPWVTTSDAVPKTFSWRRVCPPRLQPPPPPMLPPSPLLLQPPLRNLRSPLPLVPPCYRRRRCRCLLAYLERPEHEKCRPLHRSLLPSRSRRPVPVCLESLSLSEERGVIPRLGATSDRRVCVFVSEGHREKAATRFVRSFRRRLCMICTGNPRRAKKKEVPTRAKTGANFCWQTGGEEAGRRERKERA